MKLVARDQFLHSGKATYKELQLCDGLLSRHDCQLLAVAGFDDPVQSKEDDYFYGRRDGYLPPALLGDVEIAALLGDHERFEVLLDVVLHDPGLVAAVHVIGEPGLAVVRQVLLHQLEEVQRVIHAGSFGTHERGPP